MQSLRHKVTFSVNKTGEIAQKSQNFWISIQLNLLSDRENYVPLHDKAPLYSWIPITRTPANSNQNRFPVDFVHTYPVILPSVTPTLDNSNLSLTQTNFHFPSSNFVYNNFTLHNSNNFFQDVTSKKIYIGYSSAGRSVLGKTVPEVLDTKDTWVLKTGSIVFPIQTDLGWWITFSFFSTTEQKACERPELL